MSRPFKLFRLQQIDSQLDLLRSQLIQVEKALADDSEKRQIENKLSQFKEDLAEKRNVLRSSEFETQQQRIKIEQTEAALYGGKVRNPKELQDLQNESAALRRYLSALEDRQFEAMLAEEDASHQFEEINKEYDLFLQESTKINHQFIFDRERLLKEIANSEDERKAAAAVIDSEDLTIYQQLRTKRRGVAVSKVVDKACSACGSTLSAALLSATRSPNHLNLCESCGRMLYIG